MLFVALLPAVAQGEVLSPHIVQPEFVTPHAAATVSPTTGEPSGASPSVGPSADPVLSPVVSAAAPSPADSPSMDGPKPKPKPKPKPQPNPDACQPKPGKVCPYFCPHGKAGSTCKPSEPREPWEREPIQTVDEYMQTVHLCAGAIEVLILGNFIDAFAIHETYEEHEASLVASGAKAARVEAWSMFERYNCQTFVMP